jgi:beta-amylase
VQCYDRFMVASLSAAAQQVGQPHWGNSGPHDAGSYCQWPHQTGFFHHQGSWYSEYGRFFLQWYSSLLLQHADQMMGSACRVFQDAGVRLHAQLPTIHWWYNQAAHAAELTAGHYNTSSRNGYLAFCQVLARHQAGLVLTGAEMRDCEQPSYALASPETQLLQLRATAASQQVPVTLSNLSTRFDADALAEFERQSFDAASYRGIDLTHVSALSFGNMGDAMFEPQNWLSFKDWAGRLRQHNEQLRHPPRRAAASAAAQRQAAGAAAAAAAAAGAQQPVPHEAEAVPAYEDREEAVVG